MHHIVGRRGLSKEKSPPFAEAKPQRVGHPEMIYTPRMCDPPFFFHNPIWCSESGSFPVHALYVAMPVYRKSIPKTQVEHGTWGTLRIPVEFVTVILCPCAPERRLMPSRSEPPANFHCRPKSRYSL